LITGNLDSTGWIMLHPAFAEFCRRQLPDETHRQLHVEFVKEVYAHRKVGGWKLSGRYYELEAKAAVDQVEELEW
jgi:hypothetical protein